MELKDYIDYRDYLKDELARRIKINANYSLRGFARDIHISPQALSLVLNKKRGISLKAATKIAQALGFNESDQGYFSDLVIYSQAKSDSVKKIALSKLKLSEPKQKIRLLQDDVFRVIESWYHYAIVELTFVKNFKNNNQWIASQLGISEHEVSVAIKRLLRLEILEEVKGTLKKTDAILTTPQDVPSAAIRSFHQQILNKASQSLNFDPIELRDFTTTTMSIDPSKLKIVKPMIRDFQRKICQILESSPRSAVYCMSVELFPLSKNVKKGKNND